MSANVDVKGYAFWALIVIAAVILLFSLKLGGVQQDNEVGHPSGVYDFVIPEMGVEPELRGVTEVTFDRDRRFRFGIYYPKKGDQPASVLQYSCRAADGSNYSCSLQWLGSPMLIETAYAKTRNTGNFTVIDVEFPAAGGGVSPMTLTKKP